MGLAFLAVLAITIQLYAANQIVTNNGDAGSGSLRQAIADVSDGGTITFNLSAGNETIVILTELLITGKGVTIDGSNSSGSTIQVTVQVTTPGTSPYRVFHVNAVDKTCMISNLYVKGGKFTGTGGEGGGVLLEQGTLNLSHVTVSDAQANNGGGIAMYAPTSCTFDWVTVSNCTGTMGGGLYCGSDNNLTLNNCLFTGNTTSDPVPSKSPNSSGGYGGGICNIGTMTINQCEISENVGAGAYSVYGIGIANLGAITISGSVIKNNSYSGDYGAVGGGICAIYDGSAVTFIIENSTISGNSINSTTSEGVMGAGIGFFNVDVTGAIINCTVSENTITAPSMALGGGVCVLLATVAISNSTIANNVASEAGAGICQVAGTLSIKNTIIAQNSDNSTKFDYNAYTAYGPCTLNDNGNNIVQYQNVAASAANSFNATTDFLYNTKYNTAGTAFSSWTKGGDANAGTLNLASAVAANGGPTQTLAITAGSIAIHSGAWDAAVTQDQRGTTRHEGTPAIGAFELYPAPGYWICGDIPYNWHYEGNWEDGIVPGATDNVTISPPAAYPRIYSNAVCNDMNIPAGQRVTVRSGYSLTVNGTLQNNAGINGVVIYSNAPGTGSLIHHTANVPGMVSRYIPGASRSWHFLASPVANQAISPGFTADPPEDYGFYTWYEPDGLWVNYKNTTVAPTWNTANGDNNFTEGKGYLVEYTGTGLVKEFSGNLNSGVVSCPLTKTGITTYATFNLLGNPYPSAIDWKAANGWDRTALHERAGGYDMYIWNDDTGNYCSFNSAGSSGINGGTQYIAVGQGFMVKAETAGTLGMDDRIRVHSTQPYLKSTEAPVSMLRLKVTGNANTYSDEIVVEFGHQTDAGGAEKMFSFYETAPGLFTVKPDGDYSVDFRGEPGPMTIPMNFIAGADGNYQLAASQFESFSPSASIILEDLKLDKSQNLMQNPVYAFTATTYDAEARFLLHFGGTFGLNEQGDAGYFSIYSSGSTVYISNNSGVLIKGEVIVYSMIGQPLLQQPLGDGLSTKISLSGSTGYYLVKVIAGDQVCSGKVFVH